MSTFDPLALPFDQYQRYTAVQQIADQVRAHIDRPHLRVLDVGGLAYTRAGDPILPLAPFLPQDQVIAVDRVAAPLANYCVADGLSLPYGDGAFGLVVSCDTLEHVPSACRLRFVDEAIRVASQYVLLVAPFYDESTRLAEQTLFEYLTAQGIQHVHLREHLDNGLPDAVALRTHLSQLGFSFVDFADGYLHRWLLMMIVKHMPGLPQSFQAELDRYYNKHISPMDRREPAYRRVFIVSRQEGDAWLSTVADALSPAGSTESASDLQFVDSLLLALSLGRSSGPAGSSPRLKSLEDENARLRALVAAYERGRFIRLMRRIRGWQTKWGAALHPRGS